MQITIVEVGPPVAEKKYHVLDVIYKNDAGEVKKKHLVSFSNPTVFKAIQGFSNGDVLEVEAVKEGDFIQWKSVSKVDGNKAINGPGPTLEANKPAGKVLGSTYATAEERAKTQVYIVRQSSISNAINVLSVGAKFVDKGAVLALAKEFENFVFGIEAPTEVKDEEII
jgi:hypothetical protein